MIKRKLLPRTILTIFFAILVFIILTVTMVIVSIVTLLLVHFEIIHEQMYATNLVLPTIQFALTSIIVGTIVAALFSRIPLKPFHTLIKGMNELANGNFNTRLHLGKAPLMEDLTNSFNQMAEELSNTEMLRSDFVNNFSHEFKTPIVSIKGFAKLLQKGNLPADKEDEYLTIIIDEVSRLADLSTSILDLTKVENQSILTDVSRFNLSEQIRNAILLLEPKWVKKDLAINPDFNEFYIEGNEDLLRQVWINLIDNAIKFSDSNSNIDLMIHQTDTNTTIAIKNYGPQIQEDEQKRIFNKYWQSDGARISDGFGIGLSIAKSVIDLHQGQIHIQSSVKETSFIVTIPNNQL